MDDIKRRKPRRGNGAQPMRRTKFVLPTERLRHASSLRPVEQAGHANAAMPRKRARRLVVSLRINLPASWLSRLRKLTRTIFRSRAWHILVLFAKLLERLWQQHRPKRTGHPIIARLWWATLAVLMLGTVVMDLLNTYGITGNYELSAQAETLLATPKESFGDHLKLDAKAGVYQYNQGYQPGIGVGGMSGGPKFTASFDKNPKKGITLTDPSVNTPVTFKPAFRLAEPIQEKNRLIYPIRGKNAVKVYTLQAVSVKEDIILNEYEGDELTFKYTLELPDGTEARMEENGSLAIYGVSRPLLGNVSTGTDKDAELLKKARQNGEKNNLLYTFPAPFIREYGKKNSNGRAWFSLKGDELTVHTSQLSQASYPLSIDPTIYVETAAKLMQGNNESNVDFDVTNELIQKSQTTGARIDGWSDSTEMNSGVWGQSMAAANGYVYRAGGRVDPTMPYIVSQQATYQPTDSTNFTMNMPSIRPAGDLYVAIMAHDGSGTVTSPPSGWQLIANVREHAAYYKVGTDQGGGNEAASYTWGGSNEQWVGVMLRIKNFDSASPISGTAGTGSLGSDTLPVFPTTTPSHDATLVIRAAGFDDDEPSEFGWLPSGHTKVFADTSSDNTTSGGLVVATLDTPPLASNATGTATLANDGQINDTYGASSVAIRPATVTAGVQQDVQWARFNTTSGVIDSPNPGNGTCSGWCSSSAYNLPGGRVGAAMFAYNGFLYVVGGTTDGTAANGQTNVWIAKLGANGEPSLWNPAGGTPTYWYQSTSTLAAGLSYAQIYGYNNKLYLVGGRNTSGNSVLMVEAADILATGDISDWSAVGMKDLTTPSARHGHSVHVYNDVMYIIGGVTSTSGGTSHTFRNTVYYSRLNSDGSMGTWTATSGFTTARASYGGQMTALWGGYIYLAGGCTAFTSGYCSTIASDVQLASINADGSLAEWNSITNLSNQRIGYSFIAWQNGLYRFGGCNRQNTSTGVCYAVHQDTEYGIVNPDGDASTVSNSEPANTGNCVSPNYTDCDLPGAGDGSEQGGQMSSMVVVNNGVIYVIGGCTSVASGSVCRSSGVAASSGNVLYAAIDSAGNLVRNGTCGGTFVTNSLWCVDSTNTLNGTTGISAGSATVFNNTIYVIGGTTGITWSSSVYRVSLNANGTLAGAWSTAQSFTNLDLGSARGYSFTFTRANPSSSTYPGNLYVLGGCSITGGGSDDGIGCNTYVTGVYKCNILASGALEEGDTNDCTTTGQLQIDADNTNTGSQGLGLMAGAVYANRIYLVGGSCSTVGSNPDAPCGSTYAPNRKDTIYAKIDNSNNIVENSPGLGAWAFTSGQMDPVRRRGVAFGYNGHIYSLAGYSGTASLQDLLFAKIDVSTGDMGSFSSSGVVVTPRWDLRAIVNNGYVYAIGGCGAGAAPDSCTSMQPEIQTFQLYNNDSGSPVSFSSTGTCGTGACPGAGGVDRVGASATIVNGYIYYAGGCTNTGCTTMTNTNYYAPIDAYGTIGTWSTAASNLPASLGWGKMVTVGGTLYYIGGQTGSATTTGVSTIYYTSSINASTGAPTWNGSAASGGIGDTNSQAAQVRTQFGATVWNDRIYVVGGYNSGGTAQATVYISPQLSSGGDISADTWTSDADTFNVARVGLTAVSYANNLYIFGGFDGTNYLSDSQFTQINSDGTIDAWTYSTSMPSPIRDAEGFASNGYLYVIGGRSAATTCAPNTIVAPISANTTIASGNNPTGIGEWYETNQRYTGDRYGAAVAYYRGKAYIMGGACSSFVSAADRTYAATLKSQPQIAKYSRMIDTDTNVFPNSWLMNGLDNSIGARWRLNYRSAVNGSSAGSDVSFTENFEQGTSGSGYDDVEPDTNINYDDCYTTGSGTSGFSNTWSMNGGQSGRYSVGTTSGYAYCTENFTLTDAIHDVFYLRLSGSPSENIVLRSFYDIGGDPVAQLQVSSAGELRIRDKFTVEGTVSTLATGSNVNRIETTIVNDTISVKLFKDTATTTANDTTTAWTASTTLDNSSTDSIDTTSIGITNTVTITTARDFYIDGHKMWYGKDAPGGTKWGQDTSFGNVTLGNVEPYVPRDEDGVDTEFARWYFFSLSIDASQTFGYPEDVDRGPTIWDLSLFFTADPSKRLLHGKTFTGGLQQPLDTPCRRRTTSVSGDPDYNCPLQE